MPRLGKFTGKIYPDDYDFGNCPECCIFISDEEANNPDQISQRRLSNLVSCYQCFGCPASNAPHLKVQYLNKGGAIMTTTVATTPNNKDHSSLTGGMLVYKRISDWILYHTKAVAEEYSENATSVRTVMRGLGDKEVSGIGFTIENGSGDEEFAISVPYTILGLPEDIYAKVYSNEDFLKENEVLMLSLIGDVMRLSTAHDRTLSWTFEPNGVSLHIESALPSVTTTSDPNLTITDQNATTTPIKFKGPATDKQIKFANAIASKLGLKDELNKLSKTKADYGKFIGDHIEKFKSTSGKTEKL